MWATISSMTNDVVAGQECARLCCLLLWLIVGRVDVRLGGTAASATNRASNGIVLSTSSDGSNWTAPAGIPIDAGQQHGRPLHTRPSPPIPPPAAARRGWQLTYYFYPTTQCTTATCQLEVGCHLIQQWRRKYLERAHHAGRPNVAQLAA